MSVRREEDRMPAAQAAVVRAVREQPGLVRSEVAEVTGLPLSTVGASVRRLLDEHIIEEFGYESSTGGRRPSRLRMKDSDGVAQVAELGQHHARVGLATFKGKIVAARSIPLDLSAGHEPTFELLERTWATMRSKAPVAPSAVGIAVPGPVGADGRVTGAARMPHWNQYDLAGALQATTGLPTVIDNDARAAAIGEWQIRRPRSSESGVYIKAGHGIGAAWISDGVAHRGNAGFAGDITHIRIQTDDPRPCTCGNSGCLETVASGAAILHQLKSAGASIRSADEMIASANGGDPLVSSLVRGAGAHLGEVLSGIVNFLNPDRIVVGGSLSQVSALLAGLRTELYKRCLPMCTENLSIETSIAGADAPLLGMAALSQTTINQQEGQPA